MAQVVYSENALANLESSFAYLAEAPDAAAAAVGAIASAVDMLAFHPLIGRVVVGDATRARDLVREDERYAALYRFLPSAGRGPVSWRLVTSATLDYPEPSDPGPGYAQSAPSHFISSPGPRTRRALVEQHPVSASGHSTTSSIASVAPSALSAR